MRLEYYFKSQSIGDPQSNEDHSKIIALLDSMRQAGQVAESVALDVEARLPDAASKQQLFEQLRDFSMRHHVGLRHIFGSRKHGFTYIPSQFLLVKEHEELTEVFPCEINGAEKGILQFLAAIGQGIPWTTHVAASARLTAHERIVERIIQDPDALETGLRLKGRNEQVSRRFGELGYIDLTFTDHEDRYLLLEVKVKPREIDEAIGQIQRYGKLFILQNGLPMGSVRLAIVCPYIPAQQREICEENGIKCFEVR